MPSHTTPRCSRSCRLREQTLPPDSELERIGDRACLARFGGYVGVPLRDSKLDAISYKPTKEAWTAGDRTVECALEMPDGPRLVGSMRGARR